MDDLDGWYVRLGYSGTAYKRKGCCHHPHRINRSAEQTLHIIRLVEVQKALAKNPTLKTLAIHRLSPTDQSYPKVKLSDCGGDSEPMGAVAENPNQLVDGYTAKELLADDGLRTAIEEV